MNFLDEVFLDNTIRSYLLVIGTILFVLLIKRYLSRYCVSIIYKLARRVWSTLDRDMFLQLVAKPVEWFLLIVISIFSIDKLVFPGVLKFEIYGHSTSDIVSRIGPGIIIIAFIWLVMRITDFIASVLEQKASLTDDTRDNQLIVFFRDFLKVIIALIGVLLIIKACFHQPIGSVLTGLSLVGAGLALAAKESLENLIASFIIFFDKPFFTGDTVKVNAVTGTVEKIGLRSTRIRTGDKTLVTVPNKQMVDSIVDNWSLRTQRRDELKLELASTTTTDMLQQVVTAIHQILSEHADQIESSEVWVKEISRNAVVIGVEYFTLPFSMGEFSKLKNDINLQVKKLLEDQQVNFAGAANQVVIRTESNEQ